MSAAAVVAIVALQMQVATADSSTPSDYLQSVQQAYDIVRNATPSDVDPAQRAERVLTNGTGQTQPEIVADLNARPPDYDDARARLQSLLTALGHPANTADPALAQQRLHEVMSMRRYDALHRPPSLIDRLLQWINDRINSLLQLLFGQSGGASAPQWIFYAIGLAALIAIAVIVFRGARGRLSEASVVGPSGPRPAADYFADADRFAAQGDRVRAIRALCAGVAATLAGERTWEGSPLTVREIFMRAPDSASLQPLLQPFEAAVYGGRDVDQATYEKAAAAAALYRRPVEVAA
ncbi:MAG TPA: hypothetical protein VNA65_01710 [Candidatus Dormibacteraeota bacterium]|nr:hypothetical protein [Candidatus Dormibacteraeota bacterium]